MHYARFRATRAYLQPDDVETAIREWAWDTAGLTSEEIVDWQVHILPNDYQTPSAEVVFYMREAD